jgi:hypothetical protein
MAKKKRTKRAASEQSGDAAPSRRINGARYDATEPERIRDLERPLQRPPANEDEFITDAELEARELDLPPEEE